MSIPHIKPETSGPGISRFLLGDGFLKLGEELHDDLKYAARAMAMRDDNEFFIRRNWDLWVVMRDGGKDPAGGPDWPGFWKKADGTPIGPGDVVPKEAYRGMVGAIKYLLQQSGVLWKKDREREHSASAMRDLAAKSKLGQSVGMKPSLAFAEKDPDPDEDDDEDEEDEG